MRPTRLLLASGGLGNRFDNVGRYYTCHVENFVGTLRPRQHGTAFHFEKTRDGIYGRRKLFPFHAQSWVDYLLLDKRNQVAAE